MGSKLLLLPNVMFNDRGKKKVFAATSFFALVLNSKRGNLIYVLDTYTDNKAK